MIEIINAITKQEQQKVWDIRRVVFVIEQNCPEEIEWEFEEESKHFLASVNGEAAGCARWRETENGIKLERFAVLKEFRRTGVAQSLLKNILNEIIPLNKKIYLHAQLTAKPLYEKNGFEPEGENFWEADIEHIKMIYKK